MNRAETIYALVAERAILHSSLECEKRLRKDAEEDAERYRWLRNDFSVMGANIDGQHSWAYRRNCSLRGPTLDAAIDTAMGAPPVFGAA